MHHAANPLLQRTELCVTGHAADRPPPLRAPARPAPQTSVPELCTCFSTMSHGWSPNDKAIAKAAAERARRRAEQEALALHANYKVNSVDDLWALELKSANGARNGNIGLPLTFRLPTSSLPSGFPEVGSMYLTSLSFPSNASMQSKLSQKYLKFRSFCEVGLSVLWAVVTLRRRT
jgi:hypothetical protein